MPFSTTTLLRFTAKLSRYLSLALLPALASEADAISQPQRKQNVRSAQLSGLKAAGAMPYLAALGPLPLRFARPGPEPTEEPPTPPEPKAVVLPADNTPVKEPAQNPAAQTPAPHVAPPEKPADVPPSILPEHAPQAALPILPDDTTRELRPEDVLPFFRYPTAAPSGENGVQVVVPFTPAQPQSPPLPPSSATYQLK
jgi:hypothetical protein